MVFREQMWLVVPAEPGSAACKAAPSLLPIGCSGPPALDSENCREPLMAPGWSFWGAWEHRSEYYTGLQCPADGQRRPQVSSLPAAKSCRKGPPHFLSVTMKGQDSVSSSWSDLGRLPRATSRAAGVAGRERGPRSCLSHPLEASVGARHTWTLGHELHGPDPVFRGDQTRLGIGWGSVSPLGHPGRWGSHKEGHSVRGGDGEGSTGRKQGESGSNGQRLGSLPEGPSPDTVPGPALTPVSIPDIP